MKHSIFGYGSLIMPTSHILRFDEDLRQERDQVLDTRTEETREKYLDLCMSDEAFEKLDKTNIEFLPVKVFGFSRYYSVEWSDLGNQLSVRNTENREDFVNGVIAVNLSEEEFRAVEETEEPYEILKISRERYQSYLSEEKLEENGIELPEEVTVFLGNQEHPAINPETSRKRNPYYHQLMLKGIDVLSDYWYEDEAKKKDFKDEFLTDLRDTTYEMTENGWKKLSSQ